MNIIDSVQIPRIKISNGDDLIRKSYINYSPDTILYQPATGSLLWKYLPSINIHVKLLCFAAFALYCVLLTPEQLLLFDLLELICMK